MLLGFELWERQPGTQECQAIVLFEGKGAQVRLRMCGNSWNIQLGTVRSLLAVMVCWMKNAKSWDLEE